VEGGQEMIVDEVSRELAALVSVVSLAVIAIAVSILRHYWDTFEHHRLILSRSAWETTRRVWLNNFALPYSAASGVCFFCYYKAGLRISHVDAFVIRTIIFTFITCPNRF
jgi:hypothetical protein